MEFNIDTERTNEVRTTTFLGDNIELKINFVWDTHRGYVNWNKHVDEQKSYKSARVEIEKYTFTETFKSLGLTKDFEVWTLIVNGHRVTGDVVDTRGRVYHDGRQALTCKVVVGWG